MPNDFMTAAARAGAQVAGKYDDQPQTAVQGVGTFINALAGNKGEGPGVGGVVATVLASGLAIEEGKNPVFPLFNLLMAIIGQISGAKEAKAQKLEAERQEGIDLAVMGREAQDAKAYRTAAAQNGTQQAVFEQSLQAAEPIMAGDEKVSDSYSSGPYQFHAMTDGTLRISDSANRGNMTIGRDGNEVWVQAGDKRVEFNVAFEPVTFRLQDGTQVVLTTDGNGNAEFGVLKDNAAVRIGHDGAGAVEFSDSAVHTRLAAQAEEAVAAKRAVDVPGGGGSSAAPPQIELPNEFDVAATRLLGDHDSDRVG